MRGLSLKLQAGIKIEPEMEQDVIILNEDMPSYALYTMYWDSRSNDSSIRCDVGLF